MQTGRENFTVTWSSPDPTLSGYVIFFVGDGDVGSVMVDDGAATMQTVDGRLNNQLYSITMVALSQHLPSTETSPEMVMLCKTC